MRVKTVQEDAGIGEEAKGNWNTLPALTGLKYDAGRCTPVMLRRYTTYRSKNVTFYVTNKIGDL